MPDKTLVIVNPAAGGGRARRAQLLAADYLRHRNRPADFIESRSAEDLRHQAAKAAASGHRFLVALGGDGTFHHLVQGALGHDVILGFFPAGNGNDIASGLGIPKDPIAAAHQFLMTEPRPVDVLEARFGDGRRAVYIGAGGMGLDAESARHANERFRRWPGVMRYIAGVLWSLRTLRPLELEAEIDGECLHSRVLLAAVANAPCYGSRFRIAPDAQMDDGRLDITLVGEMPWTRIVEAMPVVLGKDAWRWEGVRRYRAKRVVLRADRPAPFHGDGELLGETPVEVEVLPSAIRVVAPKQG